MDECDDVLELFMSSSPSSESPPTLEMRGIDLEAICISTRPSPHPTSYTIFDALKEGKHSHHKMMNEK